MAPSIKRYCWSNSVTNCCPPYSVYFVNHCTKNEIYYNFQNCRKGSYDINGIKILKKGVNYKIKKSMDYSGFNGLTRNESGGAVMKFLHAPTLSNELKQKANQKVV